MAICVGLADRYAFLTSTFKAATISDDCLSVAVFRVCRKLNAVQVLRPSAEDIFYFNTIGFTHSVLAAFAEAALVGFMSTSTVTRATKHDPAVKVD